MFGAADPLASGAAGLALLALAAGWLGWATLTLARAGALRAPGRRPRVLVDEGPFRHSRHPLLLGTVLAFAGLALAVGQPALLLADLAFVAAATRWIIPATERRLARSFGGWWRDYAASTPRWM